MSESLAIRNFKIGLIDLAIVVAMLVVFVIAMYPYVRNGFWFDDSLNSQTWGLINRADTSVYDFSIKIMTSWFHAGRLMLSFPFIYGFYYLIHDPVWVRVVDVALVAVNIGLVVYLLRFLQVSWQVAGLFVLFLLVCFQIRDYHDPIASYATFLQVLVIELTVSLVFLVRWLKTGSVFSLLLSSFVALLSVFCYELNVIYVPIALLIIVFSSRQKKWQAILVVTVPFVFFVLATLYIKSVAAAKYSGSDFGALEKIPITYFVQFVSGFPGSFYFLRGENDFSFMNAFASMRSHTVSAFGLIALSLFCFWSFSRKTDTNSGGAPVIGIVLVALVLLFFPPLLIAMSSRYQSELSFGLGHIAVYYQYFGFSLLAAFGLFYASQRMAGGVRLLLCLGFSGWLGFNFIVNLDRSEKVDATFEEPRASLVRALKSGLFELVQDGDIVEIPDQPIFINGNLIYQVIQKRVYVPDEQAIAGLFDVKPNEAAKVYRLTRQAELPREWQLSLVR
ncbi:hypothetical protein PMI21_03896 [Pseudomonas sp. GM18]|uniref:hypothetical protein n=1 Tax=Pseudomonas sp. GM18 TaxID=1144324 RepID=UPI0002725B28|nr:hypothetical protein [Pseudomonas sp. GM18]EJM14027.1 hypothetical protein PMI21_03896 [Pseudomonas sp. GM18]